MTINAHETGVGGFKTNLARSVDAKRSICKACSWSEAVFIATIHIDRSARKRHVRMNRLQIALHAGYDTAVAVKRARDADGTLTEADDEAAAAAQPPSNPADQIVVDSGEDSEDDIPLFVSSGSNFNSLETFVAVHAFVFDDRAVLRATNSGFFFAETLGTSYNELLEAETRDRIRTLTYTRKNKVDLVDCGSFNCSHLIYLPDQPQLRRLIVSLNAMDAMPTNDDVFARIRYPSASNEKLDKSNDEKNRFDELVTSCKLALKGIGPSIIAAVPMKFIVGQITYDRHLYVFELGYVSLDTWLREDVGKRRIRQRQKAGVSLLEMVKKLSDEGIVLFDSKPSNMVILDVPDRDLSIRFIDFDHSYMARFTNIDNETRDCLFLVNGVLLISAAIGKQDKLSNTSFHFFESLLNEMERIRLERLIIAHGQYTQRIENAEEWPPPGQMSTRGMLCRVFDEYGRDGSQVRDFLQGSTNYTNKAETIVKTNMNTEISTREIRLANHVLERLQHYGSFLKNPMLPDSMKTPKQITFEGLRDTLVKIPTETFFELFILHIGMMSKPL